MTTSMYVFVYKPLSTPGVKKYKKYDFAGIENIETGDSTNMDNSFRFSDRKC